MALIGEAMALVHGKEQYAHLVVTEGENVMHRRIHKIRIHPAGRQPYIVEGKNLPNYVHICTDKDGDGNKVIDFVEKPPETELRFDLAGAFLMATAIAFGGCAVIFFQAIEAAAYM
jgi:hypothetical protein